MSVTRSILRGQFVVILVLIVVAGVFVVDYDIDAKNAQIIITKVQIAGESTKDDMIVLENISDEDIDIYKWKLRKRTSSGKESSVAQIKENDASCDDEEDDDCAKTTIIKPGKTYVWARKGSVFDDDADLVNSSSLSENYSIALLDTDKDVVSALTWGTNQHGFSHAQTVPNPTKCEMIVWDNKSQSYNIVRQQRKACKKVKYDGTKILINEVLPNPREKEEKNEFIELYNPNDKSVNLYQWKLRDGAKSTKSYIFDDDARIDAHGYIVIKRKDFRFALNNSGGEEVKLLAPDDTLVDHMTYQSAKEGVSYNRVGSQWRPSLTPTPNKENIVPPPLKITHVDYNKTVYRDVSADFSVQASQKDVKVRWDFGDGHRSYKQRTTHKYHKSEKFPVVVRVSNQLEDVERKFIVHVKKYPRYNVRITEIMPNPKGKDTGVEYITIINKSDKKLNLKGWSVATGKDKKSLVNHPIKKKLIIKHKKERKITSKYCALTLPNGGGIVEIRRADGSVAHRKKYDNPTQHKTIPDNARYHKSKDAWQWDIPPQATKSAKSTKKTKQKTDSQIVQNIVARAWDNEFGVQQARVLGLETHKDQSATQVTIRGITSRTDKFLRKLNRIYHDVYFRIVSNTKISQKFAQYVNFVHAKFSSINNFAKTETMPTNNIIATHNPQPQFPRSLPHPSVIALSLAHLSPHTAGEVLAQYQFAHRQQK